MGRPGPAILAFVIALGATLSARAHLPHDPIAAVALAGTDDSTQVVAQYLYPGRPIVMVSEDEGRSWGYLSPPGMNHEFIQLLFATEDVLFAADEFEPALFVSEDGGWTLSSPAGAGIPISWCAG